MSKASSAAQLWKQTATALDGLRWRPVATDGAVYAYVEKDGSFAVNTGYFSMAGRERLNPAQAISLARWILDTFGDEVAS